MRMFMVALLLLYGVQPAGAQDEPIIAPTPKWVIPVSVPASATKGGDAPIQILLADGQVKVEGGEVSTYQHTAIKVQTPTGLAIGNLSFPWRPEASKLVVHKLAIRRGNKVIDVLSAGQRFTVVRREQNLDNAVLDGVLTANIQPQGLQVGDVLEFAVSTISSDPVLKGHAETFGAAWNGIPSARGHFRALWPADKVMQVRTAGGLPNLAPKRDGNMMTIELTLDGIEPVRPPNGAPARYQMGRILEMTDYASWAEIGALMAPLYAAASTVPKTGPLRDELEQIRKASASPQKRAEAALMLVQDNIRYVALAMGQGGLVPADATATWVRRFGDCKAKSALLLALLHELGIEADPVAVSSALGDGLDERLPMVGAFDHVLVRARIDGKIYWLDGTRNGDNSLARLKVPHFHWGLPLIAANAALIPMVPEPLHEPDDFLNIQMDARQGLLVPAPVRIESIKRGDAAQSLYQAISNLGGEARERSLREYWRDQFDFIEPKAVAASFDAATGELKMSMDGLAQMEWQDDWLNTHRTRIAYQADFRREDGPDKDAPFSNGYPFYSHVVQTIQLPPGFDESVLDADDQANETIAGVEYRRSTSFADNVFKVEVTERSIAPEFSAAEARTAQKKLRALYSEGVSLRMPANYPLTNKDLAQTPVDAEGFARRGNALRTSGQTDAAIADYTKATELVPDDEDKFILRARAYVDQKKYELAEADLATAERLDSANNLVWHARAFLESSRGKFDAALKAADRAIQAYPQDTSLLALRAYAHTMLGHFTAALADLDAAIKMNPKSGPLYAQRASLLGRSGNIEKALQDADKSVELNRPKDAGGWIKVAATYRAAGAHRQAGEAADKAVALAPDDSSLRFARAYVRYELGDRKGVLEDTGVALANDPTNFGVWELRIKTLRVDQGRAATLTAVEKMLKALPKDQLSLVLAGKVYAIYGQQVRGMALLDQAIKVKPEAYVYVNRAEIRSVDDDKGRLADLDRAIELDPEMVEARSAKIRLLQKKGDLDGAAAMIAAALAQNPGDVSLMIEQGIILEKRGDSAGAEVAFAKVRQASDAPAQLNDLCWTKARQGVALESALADCNLALERQPNFASYLDSRGLVLLRLGRLDEAIRDYDAALATKPSLSWSLYGRAVARAKQGDAVSAEADRKAALAFNPQLEREFDQMGLMFAPEKSASSK